MSRRAGCACVAVLAIAACTTDLPRAEKDLAPDEAPANDAAPDEPLADVGIDAPVADMAPEAAPDEGAEPLVDAGADTSIDMPPDLAADGGPCPDGFCDMAMGEDDFNCPQDCGCAAAASCNDLAPFGCACDVCSIILANNCLDAQTFCGVPDDPCGNGVCDYCEDATNCPSECP